MRAYTLKENANKNWGAPLVARFTCVGAGRHSKAMLMLGGERTLGVVTRFKEEQIQFPVAAMRVPDLSCLPCLVTH